MLSLVGGELSETGLSFSWFHWGCVKFSNTSLLKQKGSAFVARSKGVGSKFEVQRSCCAARSATMKVISPRVERRRIFFQVSTFSYRLQNKAFFQRCITFQPRSPTLPTLQEEEEGDVLNVLKTLDPNKACGADEIGLKLLRMVAPGICRGLTPLFLTQV